MLSSHSQLEFAKQFEKNEQEARNNMFAQQYQREYEQLKNETWIKFHLSNISPMPENIAQVRNRLEEKRKQIFEKYKTLAKQYKTAQDNKTKEQILNIMKKSQISEMDANPAYNTIKKAIFEKHGYTIGEEQFSEEELQEFVQTMNSRDGDALAKHFANVLPDDYLQTLGYNTEEYKHMDEEMKAKHILKKEFAAKNEQESKQQQQQSSTAKATTTTATNTTNTTSSKPANTTTNNNAPPEFNQKAFENFKYMVQKEAQKNPQVQELFEKQHGSLDEFVQRFETDLKSGSVFKNLTPMDIQRLMNTAKNKSR